MNVVLSPTHPRRARRWLGALLTFSLTFPAFSQQRQAPPGAPPRPRFLIGFDAQPITNFARIKAIGGNALHRYENGPAKNVTLKEWVTAADQAGLYSIIQGSAADAQGVDLASLPKTVVAISQDDEPDINRWPYTGDAAAKERAAKWLYTPEDAPHKSAQGWTRPEILQERYDRWKKKTRLPIIVNFAGPSINSGWYRPELQWHQGYIKASDLQGFDLYPKNGNGDGGHLYWPANVMDKINAAGGKCRDAYIECAFGGGTFKRGPTAAEQSVITWSLVGHGARSLWYFPQRVNPPFSYWAMTPENEAAAKADIANIFKYADLIDGGKLTVVQTPKAMNSNFTAPGNTLVWPNTEEFTWELNGDKLVVSVDYEHPKPPVLTYTGSNRYGVAPAGAPATLAPASPAGPRTMPPLPTAKPARVTPTPRTPLSLEARVETLTTQLNAADTKADALAKNVAELTARVNALEQKVNRSATPGNPPR